MCDWTDCTTWVEDRDGNSHATGRLTCDARKKKSPLGGGISRKKKKFKIVLKRHARRARTTNVNVARTSC